MLVCHNWKLVNIYQTFPRSRNLSMHVNIFLEKGTFLGLQSFFLSERKLGYGHHKSKGVSCLTTNSPKTLYHRKLNFQENP